MFFRGNGLMHYTYFNKIRVLYRLIVKNQRQNCKIMIFCSTFAASKQKDASERQQNGMEDP
jgi:hypothetical protein